MVRKKISTLDLIEIALARISGETQKSVGKRMNLQPLTIGTTERHTEYQEIRQKLTDMIIDESARLFVQEHMSQRSTK